MARTISLALAGALVLVLVPRPALAAQDPPTAADVVPTSIHVMEGGVAEVAGIRIPVSPDTFALTRINRAPRRALGVVIGYESPVLPQSDVTFYVFPLPQTIEEHFDRALVEIRDAFGQRPDIELELEPREQVAVEGTDGVIYDGLAARGAFVQNGTPRATELWVFRKGSQLLKHRFSYPASLRGTMEPHFRALLAETLGDTDVANAPTDTVGTILEAGPSTLVLDGVHYPTRADTFDLFEVQRNANPRAGMMAVYRSPVEGAPTLNVIASPENGGLEEAFRAIVDPVLTSAARSGVTPEMEPATAYEQGLDGGRPVAAMKGSLSAETPNGWVRIAYRVTELGPRWIVLQARHPPAPPDAERMDPEDFFRVVLASIQAGLGG